MNQSHVKQADNGPDQQSSISVTRSKPQDQPFAERHADGKAFEWITAIKEAQPSDSTEAKTE